MVLSPPARDFGYFVGDIVELRVAITATADTVLNRTSLPVPGQVGDALELRDIAVSDRADGDHHTVELRLRYQIFLAPDQVMQGFVPGFSLHFSHGPRSFGAQVPEWLFFVSPLRLARRSDVSTVDLRGNHAVPMLDEGPARARVVASAALMVLAFFVWAGFRGWLPGLRPGSQKPFAAAASRVAAAGGDTAAAFRALHGAFDATACGKVFAEDLDDFFSANPRFSELRRDIRTFFQHSREFFFTKEGLPETVTASDIGRLARMLRRVERQW